MDPSRKSKTLIRISLLIVVAGVIVMVGPIFNIPVFQTMASTFGSLLIFALLIIVLLFIWNSVDLLNKLDKQQTEAEDMVKLMDAKLDKSEEQSTRLQKNEENYRSLIEQASNAQSLSETIINSLPGIFYFYNYHGKLILWNKNLETVYGYTKEELKTINAKIDLLAVEDRERVGEAIEKVFRDGYATIEARAVTKDGIEIPFLFTGARIMYENQLCLLGTGIDISSRIKAEEELKSSEQKYKLLFDSNPMPMWMIARDDQSIIDVNEAAVNHYGYTRAELLQMSTKALRPPEDHQKQLEDYRKDWNEPTDPVIARHIKKDGSMIFVQLIAHDIIFQGKQVRLSLTNDITEKLNAEESHQKSEANLQAILKTTDTAYALFDTDLKLLAFNQKTIEFVEEKYDHVPEKGDMLTDYFPPGKFPRFINFSLKVLKGNNINYEIDYPQTDGSITWYYVRLFPITNDKKDILGMMIAVYDITERKSAEQDLTSAYKHIQNQINSIKDMAWKQSHLIRSPLANLKGLAAMLTDEPSDAKVLDYIQNELDRMDAVIIEMASEASDHDIYD